MATMKLVKKGYFYTIETVSKLTLVNRDKKRDQFKCGYQLKCRHIT